MLSPRGRTPSRRRWYWAGGVVLGACLVVVLGLFVVYPRVGAWMIRDKVGGKVARKLGRDVRFGTIDVSLGHVTMRNVTVRGPLDGDTPLVHIDRIEVDFDAWRSLYGKVVVGDATIDGVNVTIRRDASGRDNIADVLERLRGESSDGGASGDGDGGRGYLPTSIVMTRGKLLADDAMTGTTALVGDGEASWKPGQFIAEARNISATTIAAPSASAATIGVRKLSGQPPTVSIDGGEISLWPKLALSGITGNIIANPDKPGEYTIDLAGGYGGVPGNLWTAKGELDPEAVTASIDLEAAKFQLARLAPILEKSPVVDYKETSVDTKVHLDLGRDGGTFRGEFNLHDLNVGHPMIAAEEVHGLDLSGQIAGSFDRTARKLELTRGDFVSREVPFSLTGMVARPRAGPIEPRRDPETGDLLPTHGPGGMQVLKLRFVIPPIECQRVLKAIPKEMAPHMAGYKLRGRFDADIELAIDWADLEQTELGGHVGIRRCRVVDEPEDSPKRLAAEFEHHVELEKGQWMSFVVGPSNPDFVPLEDISQNLVKSVTTTEDGAFFKHKGFIPSEFRTALISNLKAGRFRHGASSITMQLVKNVLLYREKTLLRKLQELFLTWHLENTLEKERILEIYFNVIEYGPGLYGIGPASRHFFGKEPWVLNPVEAAFFSSILPSPKPRYKQYCAGTLTRWTTAKIQRILALMLSRKKITQEEYDQAVATPLLFVKDGTETEQQCYRRVKKAIKNARSTNPLKQ